MEILVAAVTAAATVVLALVTLRYVRLTERTLGEMRSQSASATEQVEIARKTAETAARSVEEMVRTREAGFAPLITWEGEKWETEDGLTGTPWYVFTNHGRFVALDVRCYPGIQLQDWDEPRFDRGIVYSRHVLGPGARWEIGRVPSGGDSFPLWNEVRTRYNPQRKPRVDCAAFVYQDVFGKEYRSLLRLPTAGEGPSHNPWLIDLRWGKVGDANCPEIVFVEPTETV